MKNPGLRLIVIAWSLLMTTHAIAQDDPQPRLPTVELTAGMYVIQAEVAQTHQQHSIGLMHRQSMGVNEGMLFVYQAPEIRCYWMRNTLIPLTIAFLDDDGTIVYLKDMEPRTERSNCSVKPVRYALEMNQGWFDQRGIKPGFRLRGIPLVSRIGL
ncbi:DUF192 domain-containing protein [Nitrosomonas sp. wSCUT-2]